MKREYIVRQVMKAAAASALIVFVAPAHAKSSSTGDAQPASIKNPGATAKKVCIREAQPGSRVAKKVCRTPEEWAIEQLARQQKAFDPNQRF